MRIRPWCLLAGRAPLAVVVFSSRSPVRAGDKPPSDATTVPARQQLVGEWKLNPELSEDLAKMRAAREEGGRSGGWGGSRGGGWGGGGGGGHHGGHGGGYGGSGGGAPRGEGGGPARSMMLTASQITVTDVDPEGQIRRFHADDQAYKDDAGNEVKARWDADRLVVETKGERGGTKETWTVGGDPRRLTVLLEIERPSGGTVLVKRVFDPVGKS